MKASLNIARPATLADVTRNVDSLETFGMNLRDWQHAIQRGGVRSRAELRRRLSEDPPPCRQRFVGGDVADAYVAAYAEWLADQAGIERPVWTGDKERVARDPWFATSLRGRLLATTPASFRQRNLFTVPEPVFHAAPGRPRVSAEQKREKARLRQKAYRQRVGELLRRARRERARKGSNAKY